MTTTLAPKRPTSKRTDQYYSVTDRKKAELDNLSDLIADAQYEVDQYQAIVNSLTQKQQQFQAELAAADSDRTRTLNNQNLADQTAKNLLDLKKNAAVAKGEIIKADNQTHDKLAPTMKAVVDKLIYSAEIINKFANTVVRAKALNPLISDSLVSKVTAAGTDANNAVALSLVALSSSLAAQSTNLEAREMMVLEDQQADTLWRLYTGSQSEVLTIADRQNPNTLYGQLHLAYEGAKVQYTKVQNAMNIVTQQLDAAQSDLAMAQVTLASLQASYAAGNAAALAS